MVGAKYVQTKEKLKVTYRLCKMLQKAEVASAYQKNMFDRMEDLFGNALMGTNGRHPIQELKQVRGVVSANMKICEKIINRNLNHCSKLLDSNGVNEPRLSVSAVSAVFKRVVV